MNHTFHGPLVRPPGTGTWTFVRVPANVSRAFGAKGRVAIAGTVEKIPFRGAMMPDGEGGHFIVIKQALRDAAQKAPGDRVTLKIAPDDEPRTVAVPRELAAAFRKDKAAKKSFEAMSYSHRKEYAEWIAGAKKEETRVSRAEKAVAMICSGARLKG